MIKCGLLLMQILKVKKIDGSKNNSEKLSTLKVS